MDFEVRIEQPLAGGWLAYCARARDLQNAENPVREIRSEQESILIEGRNLANRH